MNSLSRSPRLFLFLCGFLAGVSTFSSCRPRGPGASAQKDAIIRSEPAWFTGGDQLIYFCVKTAPEVDARIRSAGLTKTADLTGLAFRTYAYWLAYLVHKGVQPSFTYADAVKAVGTPPVPTKIYDVHITQIDARLDFDWPASDRISAAEVKKAFPVAMSLVLNCEDADLEVHFGTRPDASFKVSSDAAEDSLLGAAYPSDVPSRYHPQWHRGAIVLKTKGDGLEYGDFIEPEFVLMHEWGHALGVPHVSGTIMDPNEIKDFAVQAAVTRTFAPELRLPLYEHAVQVDRWRQLVLCEKELCENYGVAMGSLPGSADLNDKRGLDTLKFQYLGVLSSADPISKVSRNFGAVDKEIDTPIAEVFRREPSYNAVPVMHKSVTINRWLNKTNLTRIVLNGNDPHTSPIVVEGDCKGKTLNLFAAGFIDQSVATLPFAWNKTDEKTPLLKAREFRDCVGDSTIVPEEKYLEISQYQDQLLRSPIERIPKEGVILRGAPFVKAMNLPAARTYCDNTVTGMQICLFQQNGVAVLRMGSFANTAVAGLAPILKEGLPTDGRLKMGWNGALNMHVPGFDSEHFEIRIGISQDFGAAKQVTYEMDVSLLAGVWVHLRSGTLTGT